MFNRWSNALHLIRHKSGVGAPDLVVILGSGLGAIAENSEILCRFSYQNLDGMPATSVHGHKGELIIGRIGDKVIWFFSGRFHLYEGYKAEDVVAPVVLAGAAAAPRMLITNAAGAINKDFSPGSFMWISDHINLMGDNPLRGVRQNPFIDLCHLYHNTLCPELTDRMSSLGIELNSGVLAGVLGPSYETPAEVRALRTLGADAVSMSTVPETIMAKYIGMEVVGLSFLANAAAGLNDRALNHDDIIDVGRTGVELFSEILPEMIELWL
ncbi:MAG: purine-nucleoside phosphorylase [Desulfuromonas sp.]|nr:MAG: purine-nucleoside phosphorylase [Desulfuromonas sp.]